MPARVFHDTPMEHADYAPSLTAGLEEALARGDTETIQAALHDLLLYKAVHPLAPADLDIVVTVLDRGGRAARTALQIVHASVTRQGTLPADREAALVRLRGVLEDAGEDRTAVRHALHLLAILGDGRAVIEHLVAAGNAVQKDVYLSPVLAAALIRYDADLADLQMGLSRRAADEVGVIREYARDPRAYEARARRMQDDEVEVL
ncbi:hypothetical protein J2129_000726 [Methanofollis sp. W23]|uniref:hypothetical protein n=1 Tax=Methanofollis sp. W23 TaxID=2817849 RepID=UPI001AE77B38|nr:hypothetical protein [Methanofollis sp. W23]MBP2145272.1 hypothetical protein [Methanofollis sp. W23]